jgi:membrane-anchored protein YejM (alkaline phosphatase superfamily)
MDSGVGWPRHVWEVKVASQPGALFFELYIALNILACFSIFVFVCFYLLVHFIFE